MYLMLIFYIVIVGFLYRISFGPYKNLGLFHLFYLSYVICILLALPTLNNGEKYYEVYVRAALLTPLFFLIGGVVGKIRFFPLINKKENYEYFDYFLKNRTYKILILFVCFFVIYLLDVGVNSSGLLFAFSNPGDSIAAMEIRMKALTSNISIMLTRLYGYSRAFIIPFLCCLFLVYRLEKITSRKRMYFIFILSLFYCAFSAAKAPVFYLILAMALTYYWWNLYKNPKLAHIYSLKFSGGILAGLFVASLFYPLLHGVDNSEAISYAWDQLNERVFEVPSSVAMKYFEVFGRSVDFLGWDSNPLLSLVSSEEKISSAQLLYAHFYSNMFSDRGLMNAAFFAMMYADFGFYSMVLGTIFCGFIVGQVQIFLNKMPVNGISLSCRAVCSLAVMQLILTDFTSILMGRGMLLLPFLLCVFAYILCYFKIKSH